MSDHETHSVPATVADKSRQLHEELDAARKYFYVEPIEINGKDGVLVEPRLTVSFVLPARVRYMDSLFSSGTRFTFGMRDAPSCKHGTRSLKEWRSQKGNHVVAWVCAVEPWERASLLCQPEYVSLRDLAEVSP